MGLAEVFWCYCHLFPEVDLPPRFEFASVSAPPTPPLRQAGSTAVLREHHPCCLIALPCPSHPQPPPTRRWALCCATTARASPRCWTMCATRTTPRSRWPRSGLPHTWPTACQTSCTCCQVSARVPAPVWVAAERPRSLGPCKGRGPMWRLCSGSALIHPSSGSSMVMMPVLGLGKGQTWSYLVATSCSALCVCLLPFSADDMRLVDGFAACLQDALFNDSTAWALQEGEGPGTGRGGAWICRWDVAVVLGA